jgi:hypothetical protein
LLRTIFPLLLVDASVSPAGLAIAIDIRHSQLVVRFGRRAAKRGSNRDRSGGDGRPAFRHIRTPLMKGCPLLF